MGVKQAVFEFQRFEFPTLLPCLLLRHCCGYQSMKVYLGRLWPIIHSSMRARSSFVECCTFGPDLGQRKIAIRVVNISTRYLLHMNTFSIKYFFFLFEI